MNSLDVGQVAAFLRVDEESVMKLARDGTLPGAKIGRAWVFLEDDVVAYLRQQIKVQTEARRSEPQFCPGVISAELPAAPKRGRPRSLP